MIAARFARDESTRLEALFRTAILDTAPEQFFEDLVDTVGAFVSAPIVVISFIDEERQWFKAKRGTELNQTPRAYSFCAHTILSDTPLVVANVAKDARFSDNPLVISGPHITAYAGAPIRLACGARIGTICAVDTQPRAWRDAEIAHLQRCARMAALHIESRHAMMEKERQRFLELALTRAETRYQCVLESMMDGLVIIGPSGAIIDSNHVASEILGLTQDELFGRVPRDSRWRAIRASGEDFPGEEHPVMITLHTGQPQSGVVMGVETPDGRRRWLTVSSYPVRRADGRIDQSIAVFRMTDAPQPIRDAA